MSVSVCIANLAIRTKILFSFITILALLAELGASALERSSTTNSTVADLTGNYALAVVYLDEMRVAVASYRGALSRELLQATDPTARRDARSRRQLSWDEAVNGSGRPVITDGPGWDWAQA